MPRSTIWKPVSVIRRVPAIEYDATYGDEIELGPIELVRLALELGADGVHIGEAVVCGLLVVDLDRGWADVHPEDLFHVWAQGLGDQAFNHPRQARHTNIAENRFIPVPHAKSSTSVR